MKAKLISVFLIIVFMCSCSKTAVPFRFEPEKNIEARFFMNTGEYEINGNVKVLSYEDIVFSFTHPEALLFLTLRVSSDGYFADIGGSADEIKPADLPDNAPVKLFAESLKAFLFEQNEFSKNENGEYLCERFILGQTVTAVFSANGIITAITCENISIRLSASENEDSVG